MGKFSLKAPSPMAISVEKATSSLLIHPDRALNAQICDALNADQWQAKHVIKAIKERMQNKNPKVQFFALMLLDMLLTNCGYYIHLQVIERKILQEMIKMVHKGTDLHIKHTALVLLNSWQEAFGGSDGKFPQYFWALDELKKSGLVPQATLDAQPIYAPANHQKLTSTHPGRLDGASTSETGNLSLSDLDYTRDIMELLNDMLRSVNALDHVATKDEVIQQLVDQCHSNQKKLFELISSTGNEEILAQALTLNDSLEILLTKHDAVSSQVVSNHLVSEEADNDDQFSQLAQSTLLCSSDQLISNQCDSTATTSSSIASEASSSVPNNALVPVDPPISIGSHKEEQDMIDHLSQALTLDSSTFGTPVPQPASTQNAVFPVNYGMPGNKFQSEPYVANQSYSSCSNYVAPWAQFALPAPEPQPTAVQSQQTQFSYCRPSAPPMSPSAFWILSPPNSFLCQASYVCYAPAGNSSPLQGNNAFGSTISSVPVNTTSCYASHPNQQNTLFGSVMNGVPNAAADGSNQSSSAFEPLQHIISSNEVLNSTASTTAGPQVNGNFTQKRVTALSKSPDSLFEDLGYSRRSSCGQKTYQTGMPGEPMIKAKE